jgi:hypothetical protein
MSSHVIAGTAQTQAANETSAAETRAADDAQLAAEQLASLPARSVVAASGGSVTTSREPQGQSAKPTDNQQAAKPAAEGKFAAVSLATRIQEMARWIAARPSFTFAEAAAASAPSPCSPTVMAYTLPDARLASALAELGYLMTAGGKNGYTVTVMKAPSKPAAACAAKTAVPAAS